MAKRRSCRRTEEENRIHAEAVRLRKLTDEQLIKHVQEAANPAQNGNNQVKKFIDEVSTLNGIGTATISKLKDYAITAGYLS